MLISPAMDRWIESWSFPALDHPGRCPKQACPESPAEIGAGVDQGRFSARSGFPWFEQESCHTCQHLCHVSESTNLFGMTSPTSLSTRDIVSAPRDANQRPLCRPRRKSVPRKPAILDKNSHAFRDVRGHTANDGPCAQLMVSACRAIGPRLSKGGLCRRHLGGAHSGTLPLTNDVTNGNHFWVRIIME